MLHAPLSKLLDWIAPDSCAACQNALERKAELYCEHCASSAEPGLRLRWLGAVPALAIGGYAGPLEAAIKRFKFAGHPELARRFSSALVRGLHAGADADVIRVRTLLPNACLVPVPLHPLRLAERGYNQAALLAKAVARELKCETELRALRRLRHTEKQSRLARAERRENVAGNFALRRAPRRSVVLVDDVLTTGATLNQCHEALTSGGVTVLAMLTLAHTD